MRYLSLSEYVILIFSFPWFLCLYYLEIFYYFISVKFAHFSVLYAIIHQGKNKNICTRCERYIVHVRPKIYLKSLKRSWNIGYRRYGILIIVKSSDEKSVEPFTRNLRWGVDKQLWLLFAQVSLQRKNDIRLVNRLK